METLEDLLSAAKHPSVRLGAARTIVELGLHQHDAETILRKPAALVNAACVFSLRSPAWTNGSVADVRCSSQPPEQVFVILFSPDDEGRGGPTREGVQAADQQKSG